MIGIIYYGIEWETSRLIDVLLSIFYCKQILQILFKQQQKYGQFSTRQRYEKAFGIKFALCGRKCIMYN